MKRLLFTILLSLLLPSFLLGFLRSRTSSGAPLKLDSTNVQFALSEKISSAPNILPGGDAIAALEAARQEWNQIPTSAVFFQPFTPSNKTLANGSDGINLVTFSDPSPFVNRSGALAVTLISYNDVTGQVKDTDIVFNPNEKFFVNPGAQGFDIQSTAVHEFGHAITADHTAVQSASMYTSAGIGDVDVFTRTLDYDDIAFASSTFPTVTHPFGSISGRVFSGGVPIFGAHVVAYDSAKNIFVSGLSLRNGSYLIDSVPPGNYSLYAEPFDGPVTPEDFLGVFFAGANNKFITSSGQAQSVAVGQNVQNADISVPSGTVSLNVTRAGRNFIQPNNSANNFSIGPGPVLVSPGEGSDQPITVAFVGDGITKDAADLKLQIEGAGIVIEVSGRASFQSGTAFVFADIKVAPDAAPGPRQIKVTGGGQTSYYTAGLVIGERDATQSIQRFAAVQQSAAEFTAIGITNLSDKAAVVRALYYDSSGELIAIPRMQNPAFFSVPAKGQVARLSQEIFQAVQQESGWVELQADQAQVYSFFLAGDIPLTKLDGSDVPRSSLTSGIFTDVRQDSTFQTEIHVANFNYSSVTLTFNFFGPTGQKLGPVTRVIGPRASFRESAQQLFPGILSPAGFITFTSTQAVNALELVRSSVALVSLNAQDLSAVSTTLISPHFAVGNAGVGNAGLTFFSRLYLANPGNQPVQATIEARDFRGRILESPSVFVNAQQIVQVGIGEAFGLLPGGPATIGSITVKSLSGGSLFGSILFGDAVANNFASELPLESVTNLGKDLLFEQLATAQGFFTGLAIYNPNSVSTQMTIEVRAPNGVLLGIKQQTLGPNEKLTNQITELVSGSANQSGGYIRVRSDQPVSAIVLFGTGSGSVLSAVPASKVQP